MNNRVLIVNDSKFESMILSDILSALGYNVRVTDEYEAVRLVSSFSPDIALVNYVMRDTFGDQLIEKIKLKNQSVKCILTSANQIDRQALKSSRIDAIVKTPIDKNSLERVLYHLSEADAEAAANVEELSKLRASIDRWKTKKSDQPLDEQPATQRQQDAIRFCPFCGHKFEGDTVKAFAFCPHCGGKFNK